MEGDLSKEKEISGWATLENGQRVRLSQEECKALIAATDANEKRKADLMPETKEAVASMFDAFDRLRKLGWQQGAYCPKNGSEFAAIQHGSTGVFTAWYSGEWPRGYLHLEDSIEHPDGIMWKPLDQLTEWEESMRQRSAQSASEFIDRLGRM